MFFSLTRGLASPRRPLLSWLLFRNFCGYGLAIIGLEAEMFAEIVEVLFLKDPSVGNSYRGLFYEARRDCMIDPMLADAKQLRNILDRATPCC